MSQLLSTYLGICFKFGTRFDLDISFMKDDHTDIDHTDILIPLEQNTATHLQVWRDYLLVLVAF